MNNLNTGDKVRISDRPSSTPDPGDDGHGYVQRRFAGQTGVIRKLDEDDGVHLVVVKFADGARGKAWIHEAHLTAVGEVES